MLIKQNINIIVPLPFSSFELHDSRLLSSILVLYIIRYAVIIPLGNFGGCQFSRTELASTGVQLKSSGGDGTELRKINKIYILKNKSFNNLISEGPAMLH